MLFISSVCGTQNEKLMTCVPQAMEEKIAQAIEQDEVLKKKHASVTSIKGVGLMAFAVVVAETDGFALINNQRQLASYAGYDIVENQSGKKVDRWQ